MVDREIAGGFVEATGAGDFEKETEVVRALHDAQPTRADLHRNVQHWPLTDAVMPIEHGSMTDTTQVLDPSHGRINLGFPENN
ncbi:hypothetical protein MMAGJ_16680 [Mycolicibacterium mageritense]|uniref:Uncharacterized protein n=1 Tax=Mycolicibacterium mageritense TaxID=53462 RepID=A0ABM7HPC7_MYCME|nr:hypothetical protein MMAGJ_16680 [Mycolicibacterium mageritense]GJJ21285.1 hypothetical protein MTY414_49580 [Mycolicibacterium mageritense]